MFAVKYKNIKIFKDEYLKIVVPVEQRDRMCKKWRALQKRNPFLLKFHFSIEQILLGNPCMLVRVYHEFIDGIKYWSVGKTKGDIKKLKKEISDIFNYTDKQKSIAMYYAQSTNGPELKTCYYCNMAYINKYTFKQSNRTHFDLDHYLDKGKCPIIGLSLMNFVPSCQCCNERIKRSQQIGGCAKEHLEAMPTRRGYNFDQEVEIQIRIKGTIPIKGTYLQNKDAYEIHFVTRNKAYEDEIDKMRYTERYQFHIAEALVLMDKKNQYPDSEIEKISKVLNVAKEQIYEDVFGEEFTESEQRCFAKLKKDILK